MSNKYIYKLLSFFTFNLIGMENNKQINSLDELSPEKRASFDKFTIESKNNLNNKIKSIVGMGMEEISQDPESFRRLLDGTIDFDNPMFKSSQKTETYKNFVSLFSPENTKEKKKESKFNIEKLAELMFQYNKEVILLTDNIKPINIDNIKKTEKEINENFQKFVDNIKKNIPMMKSFFIKLVEDINEKEELREKDKAYLNIYHEEEEKWKKFVLGNYLIEREEIINYIKKNMEIINTYNKKLLIKSEENNILNKFKKKINSKLTPLLLLFYGTNLDFFMENSKEDMINEINEIIKDTSKTIQDLEEYENILLKEDFKTLDKEIRDLTKIIDVKLDEVKQKDKKLQDNLKNIKEKYVLFTKKTQIKVNEKNIYKQD